MEQKITILCSLTCHDCLGVTFSASPGTVGRVKIAVVGCRGCQALYLAIQSCESPVEL